MSAEAYINVVPGHDLCEHDQGPGCWCSPTPDHLVPKVLVHHAADGREVAEDKMTELTEICRELMLQRCQPRYFS